MTNWTDTSRPDFIDPSLPMSEGGLDGHDASLTEASPIRQPLTLDDVSTRINTIMTDYVEQAKRVKTTYDRALDALAADVEASPDLDKDAVNSIIFGRMKKMLTEAAQVFG